MNPLVSIVIPTYGGAKFLRRCIKSVLSQTYDNCEIIVVDDNGLGSPCQVETSIIMEMFAGNTKVKYICHDVNKNGAAARNTGVNNASGEYIALLDDDDIFRPDKIARQVNLLKSLSEEYAFVYCSHEIYVNDTLLKTVIANRSGYLFYEKLSRQIEIQTSGILLKKSVFFEVGGFNESFRRHQDWEFIERIMSKYKVQADNFIGYRRELCFRNSASSASIVKEWRMHYLKEMMPYISLLPIKQVKRIIIQNKIDIALAFLKERNIVGFLREYIGACPGFYGTQLVIYRLLQSFKRGGPVYAN